MSSFDDLLRRLDSAESAQWEEEYARSTVELTRDQAFEVVTSKRIYANWFAFRFDAGPPGEALPSMQAALESVLCGKDGSPLDAYRVLFASPPISEEVPADIRLALLSNATACALKRGTTWLATWLAARAGLAAIALGKPELAWSFLDGLTFEGRRHPNLDKLAIFEPLRHSETAQRSFWVRANICRLWPDLSIPAVPSLPFPDFATDEPSVEEILNELSRIGATQVRAMIEESVKNSIHEAIKKHAEEPLVRELRKRVFEGNLEAPTVDHVPAWFLDWAHAVAWSGEPQLARLAGLVLHKKGSYDKRQIAVLVLPAAYAQDLEILTEGIDAPELQSWFAELTLARELLPVAAADALVAMALPRNARHQMAIDVLAQYIEQLQDLDTPPGGIVQHIATRLRSETEKQQREHEAARPYLKRLIDDVCREASQLNTMGRRFSEADVNRAVEKVEVPEITGGLLAAATRGTQDLLPLEQVLLNLTLLRALDNSTIKNHWEIPLANAASNSISLLRVPQLFELRLRLLNRIIQAANPTIPTAMFYYQRAGSRLALQPVDSHSIELALCDQRTAIRLARAEGAAGLFAAATAAWVKTLVWRSAEDSPALQDYLVEAESAIANALELSLKPIDKADLYYARASLLLERSPEKALEALESALQLLVPGESLWAKIAAEVVQTLSRIGSVEKAVQRGTKYLDSLGGNSAVTELGLLNLVLGEALLANECWDDARRKLEACLELVRGRDPLLEVRTRYRLACLGLTTNDHALNEEHLRFLQDHREELSPLTRVDIDLLKAAALRAQGDTAQYRAVLTQTRSIVERKDIRVGLSLEIALLDLAMGQPVQDLDVLVMLGIKTELNDYYSFFLIDLIYNHGNALAPRTREEALQWARRRRPSIIAYLQHAAGKSEEARATLQNALADELDEPERIQCSCYLKTLVNSEAPQQGLAPSNELKDIYPARSAQTGAPVASFTAREIEYLETIINHPASLTFMEVVRPLVNPNDIDLTVLDFNDRLVRSAKKSVAKPKPRNSLIGRPDLMEELLSSLTDCPDDAARPGRLAACVVLLANLTRLGRRTESEVRTATNEAIDSIGEVQEPFVQSFLMQQVAVVWCPNNHADDPVRDFALAVDLLQQCVEKEDGEDNATHDTLGYLARALRYSPVGDVRENLREARRLYSLLLERARSGDSPDIIANLECNLAEVESQMGTGSRLERMRTNEQCLEQAVATAKSPNRRAQYGANLAWEQTEIGVLIGGTEGQSYLEKALANFNAVDPTLLDEQGQRNVESNRQVCEGSLMRLKDGPAAEIVHWRNYLAKLDGSESPYYVATAKHNLANALMFGSDVTRETLAEGLRLSHQAAEVRTIKANPRHHWETALNIGRALLGPLLLERYDLLTLTPHEAMAEAYKWLRRAVTAARELGDGEELLDAAFDLLNLASKVPTTERFIEATEDAWDHITQASPYLLLNYQSREREALAAMRTGLHLAYRLAKNSLAIPSGNLSFVLHGESARLVERWIVRAQLPLRRPLQARLSRPQSVQVSIWDKWQGALSSCNQRQIADTLERVRQDAPTFLAEDHTNEVTWQWLKARPGSIGVALILAEPVSLAWLMETDDTGECKTWVLGLKLGPPPLPLDELRELMRGAIPKVNSHVKQDKLAQWLRRGAVEPIIRFLGACPSLVLWSPGPGLRLVAPNAVWGNVPVVEATSLVLPDLSSAPSRRPSSLLVLADPGAEAPDPRLDLHSQGLKVLEALEHAAANRGPVRLLGSVGKRFGRALLGKRSEVRDTPASARDVLLEAKEHETIVIVAHGEVETLEEAAVLCLDASGSIDRLNVAQLVRFPDAFAGATVLMLSCESGRMGNSLVEPGGLAGTLLAAGAACVVAPLWPVRLDVAERVGRAVLDGMATGDQPWQVLARLNVQAYEDSPMLGGPAPSPSERQTIQALQRRAFVAWIG